LALLNVTADTRELDAPALMLMFVRLEAMEAVSVPPLSPKDTPLLLEKVNEFTAVLVLLAEIVMLLIRPAVDGTV